MANPASLNRLANRSVPGSLVTPPPPAMITQAPLVPGYCQAAHSVSPLVNRIFSRSTDIRTPRYQNLLPRSEPRGSQTVHSRGRRIPGGLLPLQRPAQSLEAGGNSGRVPAGPPLDEKAPKRPEDQLGDLELALVGPVLRT